jgi:hypothetical protein
VIVNSANVRTGDSTSYPVITSVSNGTSLPIVAISSTGSGWYLVELPDGRRGWMAPVTLTASGNLNGLPEVAPPPPPVAPTTRPATGGGATAVPGATVPPGGQPTPVPADFIIPLTISTSCVATAGTERIFITTNPNGREIPISWRATTGESAFFFARPSGQNEIRIRLSAPLNEVTFTIDWGTGTAQATSGVC